MYLEETLGFFFCFLNMRPNKGVKTRDRHKQWHKVASLLHLKYSDTKCGWCSSDGQSGKWDIHTMLQRTISLLSFLYAERWGLMWLLSWKDYFKQNRADFVILFAVVVMPMTSLPCSCSGFWGCCQELLCLFHKWLSLAHKSFSSIRKPFGKQPPSFNTVRE